MWKAAVGALLLGFLMQSGRAWADVQLEKFDPDKHVAGGYFVTFKPVRELRSMPRAGPNAPLVLPFALPITEAAARRIGEAFAAHIGARLGNSYNLGRSSTFMVVLRNAPEAGILGVVALDPRVQSIRRILQTRFSSISGRVPAMRVAWTFSPPTNTGAVPPKLQSASPIASAGRRARVPKYRRTGCIVKVPQAGVV
jgi:hypothetical protein